VQDVCDVSVAMAAYRDYGLTAATADRVLGEVRAAVAHWRLSATRALIPRAEQETMAAAFQAVD